MMVPRALVITPVLDGDSLLSALDQVLAGVESVAQITAQLINTATVNRSNKEWLLFPILDKGSVPHPIGDINTVLGNREKDFGPVRGPVNHPGTRPYDITGRVQAYLNNQIDRRISYPFLSFAGFRPSAGEVPWATFRKVLLKLLSDTLGFAVSITPDAWVAVKGSYKLLADGVEINKS